LKLLRQLIVVNLVRDKLDQLRCGAVRADKAGNAAIEGREPALAMEGQPKQIRIGHLAVADEAWSQRCDRRAIVEIIRPEAMMAMLRVALPGHA
jgi:hypothetical protein